MLYSTLTYKCSCKSIAHEHKTAVCGHGGYFQVQAGTAQTRAWYSLLKPIRAVVSNSFWAGGRIGRNMTSWGPEQSRTASMVTHVYVHSCHLDLFFFLLSQSLLNATIPYHKNNLLLRVATYINYFHYMNYIGSRRHSEMLFVFIYRAQINHSRKVENIKFKFSQ